MGGGIEATVPEGRVAIRKVSLLGALFTDCRVHAAVAHVNLGPCRLPGESAGKVIGTVRTRHAYTEDYVHEWRVLLMIFSKSFSQNHAVLLIGTNAVSAAAARAKCVKPEHTERYEEWL